ncbi:MAG: CAP domain-containing protein [Deltaproteobacteria bacterium]|nr:CAP domain-containing protein [Deltaproteobacteria bacterium]
MIINKIVGVCLLFLFSSCTKTNTKVHSGRKIQKTQNAKEIAALGDITVRIDNFSEMYDDTSKPTSSSSALLKTLREYWNSSGKFPRYSRGLSKMAEKLIGFRGQPVENASLSKLAAQYGITSPWMAQTSILAKGADNNYFLKRGARILGTFVEKSEINHFGFALMETGKPHEKLLVLLMQTRKFTHSPFSRLLQTGEKTEVSGTVDNDITGIEIFITMPSGEIVRKKIGLEKRNFRFALDICRNEKSRGLYSVEIMGKDSGGPVVLGIFPIICSGKLVASSIVLKPMQIKSKISEKDFSKTVFNKINELRKKRNLPKLIWSNDLAKVSKSHSSEMCKKSNIYHVSTITGTPAGRAKKAGLDPDLIGENVAAGPTIDSVFNGWMRSEGHRLNMIHKKAKYGAVGSCKSLSDNVLTWYSTFMIGNW